MFVSAVVKTNLAADPPLPPVRRFYELRVIRTLVSSVTLVPDDAGHLSRSLCSGLHAESHWGVEDAAPYRLHSCVSSASAQDASSFLSGRHRAPGGLVGVGRCRFRDSSG